MPGMITRCPKCATAFRISESHLQSAQGMVRCGNCLEVFDAKSHIEHKSKPLYTSSVTGAGEDVSSDTTKPHNRPAPADNAPADDATPEDQDEPTEEDDEAWALELLKDDSDLNVKLRKIVTREDIEKSESVKKRPANFDIRPAVSRSAKKKQSPAAAPSKPEAGKASPVHSMLSSFETDPLEVSWDDPKTVWRKRLMWAGFSFAAALVLLAQVAWLEFHRLAKAEPYRSVYSGICFVIGCTLPKLEDRSLIATSNLIIRSHPTEPSALVVDVMLENQASFEQRFPALALIFSDLQNQPVAVRRFTPDEYLGGELAGSTHMPVNQPIHIGFAIQDPGDNAQSYRITIVD